MRVPPLTRGRSPSDESGVSLVGMLASLVVLAVLVVVSLNFMTSSTTTTTTAGPSKGPTTTAPSTPASGAVAAAVAACRSDFVEITTAIDDYRALNGSTPPAGTSWATSSANGGPLLQAWPQEALYFHLTWNGTTLSVVPARGVASHGSAGTLTPRTGCYAT
ncbi:MAG: hypothetical protein ACRDV0_00380 [Acidimicrobiales bacterium]